MRAPGVGCNAARGSMSTGWPFGALTPSKYGVILMDAAWLFEVWSAKGEGKSAGRHYRCMTMAELKALPVRHLAAPDCALVMWGVWSMLPQALDLMKGYGFTYKTGGAFGPNSPTGRKWAFGPGYIFRSASEPFLYGTVERAEARLAELAQLDRGGSARAFAQARRAARDAGARVSGGAACELFARSSHLGCETWGNEPTKFDEELKRSA